MNCVSCDDHFSLVRDAGKRPRIHAQQRILRESLIPRWFLIYNPFK